jgi:hypothetical protein
MTVIELNPIDLEIRVARIFDRSLAYTLNADLEIAASQSSWRNRPRIITFFCMQEECEVPAQQQFRFS